MSREYIKNDRPRDWGPAPSWTYKGKGREAWARELRAVLKSSVGLSTAIQLGAGRLAVMTWADDERTIPSWAAPKIERFLLTSRQIKRARKKARQ